MNTIELIKVKTDLVLSKHQIKEMEAISILNTEFSAINPEENKLTGDIYRTVTRFATFTKQLVRKGNMAEIKHCFAIAEKLLREGNGIVRNAMENVYMYSLISVLSFPSSVTNGVRGMLGNDLSKVYYKQVHASGI